MGWWLIGTTHLKGHKEIENQNTESKTSMPKFNLDLNLSDAGTAEGYEAWPEDKLPATGSYSGKLKILQITYTSESAKNPNKPMLRVGVELVNAGEATGYVAFRNIVLLEQTRPFINQFLRALTDGSDTALVKAQNAFENNLVVDEAKKNILKFGTWKINSPNGELPIKVSIKRGTYTPSGSNEVRSRVEINSFLLADNSVSAVASSTPAEEPIAEEDDLDVETVEEEAADESLFDDEEDAEDTED